MERKFPYLCKPITIGRVTFRNRMFSAPMGGTDITNDGCIGPKSTAFYELRAKGGAGAVTISECMVHPKTDGSHAYHLDTAILNSLASFTYTADAIRRHGAIPSVELSHSGMYSGTYMTDKSRQHGLAQWGPSACVRPDGVEVGELTHEMIDEIVAAYGDAVRQNSPGECVITSGTSDCMRCKKIAKAGQVPAFFVSPVVVWGMAGLACAGA